MEKKHLSFRIELTEIDHKDKESVNKSDEFAKKFCASFGLKTHSGTWSYIEIDNPRFPEFVAESQKLIHSSAARFDGFCSLGFEYTGESLWYQLFEGRTPQDAYPIFNENDVECKACKYNPNMHTDGVGGASIIVSEKFKKVVEENNLTGIEFLWVKDVGRYKPYQQWYLPVILNPIGRGIDHEWFDPLATTVDAYYQPNNHEFRRGISRFDASQLKKDYPASSLEKEIISLFRPNILTIFGCEQVLKGFTPDTDFSFWWQFPDHKNPKRKTISRNRTTYVSKRARDILIENKIAVDQQFRTVKVLDALPPCAEMLDGKAPLPKPYFSNFEISYETAKQNNTKEWNTYAKKPKPEMKISLKKALNLLNSIKKNEPDDFLKPLKKNIAESNPLRLPSDWIELLRKTNGGYLCDECELIAYQEIEACTAEKRVEGTENHEEYKDSYIVVAKSIDGDFYVLSTELQKNNDCPVLRVTHEGYTPIEEWSNISMFIYDMLVQRNED